MRNLIPEAFDASAPDILINATSSIYGCRDESLPRSRARSPCRASHDGRSRLRLFGAKFLSLCFRRAESSFALSGQLLQGGREHQCGKGEPRRSAKPPARLVAGGACGTATRRLTEASGRRGRTSADARGSRLPVVSRRRSGGAHRDGAARRSSASGMLLLLSVHGQQKSTRTASNGRRLLAAVSRSSFVPVRPFFSSCNVPAFVPRFMLFPALICNSRSRPSDPNGGAETRAAPRTRRTRGAPRAQRRPSRPPRGTEARRGERLFPAPQAA